VPSSGNKTKLANHVTEMAKETATFSSPQLSSYGTSSLKIKIFPRKGNKMSRRNMQAHDLPPPANKLCLNMLLMPMYPFSSFSLQQILTENLSPLCSPVPWCSQRRKGKKGMAFLYMCQANTDVNMIALCCFIFSCRIKRQDITSSSIHFISFQH